MGRLLISIGVLLVIVGAIVLFAEKFGFPLGRLPGDFTWRGKNSAIYLPLGTSLLVSILLSLFFYVLSHLRR